MSGTVGSNWQPSTARVVAIEGFGPFPRGVLQTQPPPLVWPVKDPGDVLDYVVDLTDALAGDPTDSAATVTVAIYPDNTGDLALQSSGTEGDLAILWLSGGIAGTAYAVTVVIGTTNGRNFSRTISLPVAALATPPASNNELTNETGAPLTDQTGVPITID
jgi:hypothetical protein